MENPHDDGDQRFRVERREHISGGMELRIVKDTWKMDGYGGGRWEYTNAMTVEDESALETLQESLNEWFEGREESNR